MYENGEIIYAYIYAVRILTDGNTMVYVSIYAVYLVPLTRIRPFDLCPSPLLCHVSVSLPFCPYLCQLRSRNGKAQ